MRLYKPSCHLFIKYTLLFFTCSLGFAISNFNRVHAQTNPIKIHYENIAIDSILTDLQKKLPYQFYYNAQQLDTNRLQFNFTANNIQEALNKILNESNLHYSIFNKNIFITKGSTIITQLPSFQNSKKHRFFITRQRKNTSYWQ